MSNNRKGKTAFAIAKSIYLICAGPGREPAPVVLMTLTFADLVIDTAERNKRWNKLRMRLIRAFPDLRGVGCWQRQKRGAWHAHIVINRYLDIAPLREMAMECGFGSFLNLRVVANMDGFRAGPGGQKGNIWRAARYVTRYLVRDVGEAEKGERVGIYFGDGARGCTVRFSWAGGRAYLWRVGAAEFFSMFEAIPTFHDVELVVALGWECLTNDEQERLYKYDPGIRAWVDLPNIDQPF